MHETKIYENVYIGDAFDSSKFDGNIISVRGEDMAKDNCHTYSLIENMYFGNPEETIKTLVNDIEDNNKKGNTLVFCSAGMDRSPFAVMLWLVFKKGFEIHDAYNLIKNKRNIIILRYEWIEKLRNMKIL